LLRDLGLVPGSRMHEGRTGFVAQSSLETLSG